MVKNVKDLTIGLASAGTYLLGSKLPSFSGFCPGNCSGCSLLCGPYLLALTGMMFLFYAKNPRLKYEKKTEE